MAKQQLSLIERARRLIGGLPSLAEVREALAATEARIQDVTGRLDEALKAEQDALLAAADGVPEAGEIRDEARREIRRLRDELHDLETVRDRQRERLADAQAAEKRAADAATWAHAEQIIGRREQAAARADAALVDLAEALRAVEHETALLAGLMGPAVQYIGLHEIRGNLQVLLSGAISNYRNPFNPKTVGEVVANQHEQVRARVRL